jgi:hypothetical protein
MPSSKEYDEFHCACTRLRTSLLPKEFSETGVYSEGEIDATRGFAVLFCAEVEYFIERQAERVVSRAMESWKAKGNPSRSLLALVATIAPLVYKDRGIGVDKVETTLHKCTKYYVDRLNNNHGVRRAHLANILNPIDIQVDLLDQVWISTLDSFAHDRGRYAHGTGITAGIDPYAKLSDALLILEGLVELDQKFADILDGFA